ncbi:MAG: nickel-dependent lactate racemase [Christensenellaceae bacterium]|jgi:nickel-dependent lactate racemase|nr:nickel-dependent lactate racemase [Christensenellaceae bacterium]
MQVELGFGAGVQTLCVPQRNLLGVLAPNEVEKGLTGEAEVVRALENPIGSGRLASIIRPGEKVAIITSDITRPMPTATVLPALLRELYAGGAKPQDITLVFALGSHRPHTPEEQKKLAGDFAFSQIRCVDGDVNDCVHIGTTRRGTPVDIVRAVAEADRRICLGNIEYHYFAGYSGGAKAVMPGVSTRAAIQSNHSRMVEAAACAGRLAGNPVREDIEEAAAMVGVDFILNVVLDEHKHIVRAVAGDVTLAHREGCAYLDELYAKPIAARADIVVVSQGGAPKDINLYQTQKALDNAKHAVKDGGVIILVGSCKEGLGEHVFEEWMTKSPSSKAMIERIGKDFQLGGHKAAAIAMVLQSADIYLVSELDASFVRSIFLTPFATVQEAFDAALAKLGSEAGVLVMPYGGSTLPRAKV